jgi:hypothetical protein
LKQPLPTPLSGSDDYRNCNSTFPEHSKELEKEKLQIANPKARLVPPQAQTNSKKK